MNKKKMYIVEFIVAILCSFKIINYSLVNIFDKTTDGFLNIIFFVCMLCYLLISLRKLINNRKYKKNNIKVTLIGIIFVFYTVVLFLFSIDITAISIIEFIVYYLFAVILGMNEDINFEKLLKYVMSLSLMSLFCFNKLFEIRWNGSVNMDISYAFLPTICAAIIHFIYYRKSSNIKFYNYILYIVNLFFSYKILLYGERGTIVCIVFLLMTCIIFNKNKGEFIELNKKNILKFALAIFTILICIIFYKNIIEIIIKITGINSYSLNKFYSLSETDISNGRFELYKTAFNGFLNHPLFGNGISTFNYYYPGTGYPHNILFQILFDGGIILLLFIIYILFKGIILKFKSKEKDSILTIFFFFSISILYLSFSNDIWVWPALWYFIGYLSKSTTYMEEKNENFNR